MNRFITLAVVSASLFLGACASHHHGDGPGMRSVSALAVHMNPQITVRGNVISVGPEPLVFQRADGSVSITWHLPPGFRFAEKGITIDGRVGDPGKPPTQAALASRAAPDSKQDQIICPIKGDGRRFTCVNRNSELGAFKYTIRVLRDDGSALQPHDPYAMNIE